MKKLKHGDCNIVCDDYNEWRKIMTVELSSATTFEIHCWNEEQEYINLALQFGRKKDFKWNGGTIIEGKVNQHFKDWLMSLPKPCDTETYNKMTPFFSIFLNNGFSSEHYGTELTKHN
mgnify:CR=1 FL=1